MAEVNYQCYVGIDWATESHKITVLDREGEVVAERTVEHSGAAIAAFVQWLLELSGGDPSKVAVGIEVPRSATAPRGLRRSVGRD